LFARRIKLILIQLPAMDEKLTVVEQKEVVFYDDELTAVRADDAQVYVSIKHMCQALGIDDNAQQQRIRRHTILSEGRRACNLHALGKRSTQTTYMLRVDLVPLWLSGIRTSSVNEEVRPKLEQFQKEAAAVLWEAFQEGRLTANPSFDELLKSDSPAAQAYRMAQAMMTLARQQLILESRLDDHETRLEQIEATMGNPGRAVTPDQASQISQAVKAVAIAYGKQTKRNEFGAVYGEMYRRFGITSYKLLPAHQFERVMKWLSSWYTEITDGADVPF
jgi:hypothetical protein